MTSITPSGTTDIGGSAVTQTFSFGSTGVTATQVSHLTGGSGVGEETSNADIDTVDAGCCGITPSNIDQFLEPTPPSSSVSDTVTSFAGQSVSSVVTFNKPVLDPILHLVNLNTEVVTVGGTSTTGASIGVTTLAKNNVLTVSGNTINTTQLGGPNGGCENNDGTNLAGRCGSFELTAASGKIQSFSLAESTTANEGWALSLSFPTAPLTKAFSPSDVPIGGVTQLTFNVSNPNNPGQPSSLSPLDFTDDFPSGLFLADTTTSNNGDCGSPSVTDTSRSALVTGDTGVSASNLTVALGQTCSITVDVSSPVANTYTNGDSNLSSTLGTVDPDTTAALTVSPTVSTPLIDPWVAGGTVLVLALAGVGILIIRRSRRSSAA